MANNKSIEEIKRTNNDLFQAIVSRQCGERGNNNTHTNSCHTVEHIHIPPPQHIQLASIWAGKAWLRATHPLDVPPQNRVGTCACHMPLTTCYMLLADFNPHTSAISLCWHFAWHNVTLATYPYIYKRSHAQLITYTHAALPAAA